MIHSFADSTITTPTIMKRLFISLYLVSLGYPSLRAQGVSANELSRATDYFNRTSAGFISAINGLSDARLNFKQGPTRWSVAEVAEHISVTEDFLMTMIREQVMKAPARAEAANLKEIDDFVIQAITDRTNKAQASEPIAPHNQYGSTAGSLAHFKKSRARTLAFLYETKDLRQHAIDSPLGKQLDGYQWLLFISGHSERHTKQINEVKADPNFPKK
jgi:hypothetical protein